jgi:AcrR family transcriptional regulator
MATPTRRYRSERRDQDAARTRADILSTSFDLFLAHGYAQVTMADIARAAGVAVKTVYASVGPKSDVLRTLLMSAMAESASTETVARVRDATTLEEVCALVAAGTRADIDRFTPAIDLLQSSMASDEQARETWQHMLAQYRGALQAVAEDVVARGLVTHDVAATTDRLWLCFGLGAWRALVADCHWSLADAEALLMRQALAALRG